MDSCILIVLSPYIREMSYLPQQIFLYLISFLLPKIYGKLKGVVLLCVTVTYLNVS